MACSRVEVICLQVVSIHCLQIVCLQSRCFCSSNDIRFPAEVVNSGVLLHALHLRSFRERRASEFGGESSLDMPVVPPARMLLLSPMVEGFVYDQYDEQRRAYKILDSVIKFYRGTNKV
jgi:hypothetical protein